MEEVEANKPVAAPALLPVKRVKLLLTRKRVGEVLGEKDAGGGYSHQYFVTRRVVV